MHPAVQDNKVVKVQKCVAGKTYTLKTALKVRAGAGTSKRWLKRSELDTALKKKAQTGEYAVLNKGVMVKCLKVSGNWIKISTGWICTRSGSERYVG